MTHLGVITEHVKFELNIEYKAEQQLPLQGSCSNLRAFTQRTYPVVNSNKLSYSHPYCNCFDCKKGLPKRIAHRYLFSPGCHHFISGINGFGGKFELRNKGINIRLH